MENTAYQDILDSMSGVGIYVIREDDHGILYYNRCMLEMSHSIRPGMACHEAWAGSCDDCPLRSIEQGKEGRSISYNEAFGGLVDIAASRMLWDGSIPAFVIMVAPHRETAGYSYHNQMVAILKSRFSIMNTVDLNSGQCRRMNLNETAEHLNTLVGDYEYYVKYALSGSVHPEDAENYRRLLSLEHLRETAAAAEDYLEEICQYRLKGEPVRWIELHIIYTPHADRGMVNILGQDITKMKSREAAEQQALQDRSYIISSLSSLFFSTYYVDLEHDTFRAVTQLSKVGDILGNEVNCDAALRIYADNFIHPDDRAEYLRVMNPEYWRRNLRWWKPSIALEYRKSPEYDTEECGRIRATAVIAQIGADDIPKTVVYLAQDITDSKNQ